jgi:formyl-CoA transferase
MNDAPLHDTSTGMAAPRGPAPLAGLRVIEAGQVLAGPFAGAVLADLGAEVLKIERLDGGDDARSMGPAFRQGDALNFHIFNRGKKSLALDLKSAEGQHQFERLVAGADVFVHNLRPGVTQALGIDGPALCARHPRLVYAEISAFGEAGPLAGRPGYEPLIQAFSGLSASNGGPEDPPTRMGASVCDQGAGLWAVVGILALLQQRQTSGRGGVVGTSLLETALVWNAQKGDAWLNEGRVPERHASGHPGFVPYEAFDTADAPLLICCGNDRLFAKLAQALAQPQWLTDERFATNRQRLRHKAALLAPLQALLRQQPRAHWRALLEGAGVPCAPVNSVPEALADPQVQALGVLQPVPGTDFSLTGLPLSFNGSRPAIRSQAPTLGQDNAAFGLAPPP